MAAATLLSTSAIRRLKKQRQKERRKETEGYKDNAVAAETNNTNNTNTKNSRNDVSEDDEIVEIEYVAAPLIDEVPDKDSFSNVIAKFTFPNKDEYDEDLEMLIDDSMLTEGNEDQEYNVNMRDFDHADKESDNDKQDESLSKKKLKKLVQIPLAQLKQFAKHPEVVEWEDVTAKDPKLLVQIKSYRNTVPIPRHWSQKRKYLAGKRGFVKPPFELPPFIKDTGITELREAVKLEDSTKRIKVRVREKMHPKLGRITVDYEKFHDAFFKHQTKPPLTTHGDLYYEGKEMEGKIAARMKRPGQLSEELRGALGISGSGGSGTGSTTGGGGSGSSGLLMPPPWLHNMQRFGLPPSYPHLRIPGLNAPIPEGAQWGYHPGGWGKPPVDLAGNGTLGGGTLGSGSSLVKFNDPTFTMFLNGVDRNIWGELEPDEADEGESYYLEDEGGTGLMVEAGVKELSIDPDKADQYEF